MNLKWGRSKGDRKYFELRLASSAELEVQRRLLFIVIIIVLIIRLHHHLIQELDHANRHVALNHFHDLMRIKR